MTREIITSTGRRSKREDLRRLEGEEASLNLVTDDDGEEEGGQIYVWTRERTGPSGEEEEERRRGNG